MQRWREGTGDGAKDKNDDAQRKEEKIKVILTNNFMFQFSADEKCVYRKIHNQNVA